ncbi:MAG: hypothetical protein R6T91_08635 [Bacteroidales bacterium]
MQRLVYIALSFLLLISISGISVNQHFCKEQLIDLKLAVFGFADQHMHNCCDTPVKACGGDTATCDIAVEDENSSCPFCHDKETKVKIKDYFVAADFNFTFVQQAKTLNATLYKIVVNTLFIDQSHNPYHRFIPPDTRSSLSFLNRYLL